MTQKVKNVNAYEKNGKEFLAIKLENGDTVFVNKGLISYAFEHKHAVKAKTKKTEVDKRYVF